MKYRCAKREYKLGQKLNALMETFRREKRRLIIRTQEYIFLVAPDDIVRIEAKGNSSATYVLGRSRAICIAKNLKEFNEQFSGLNFMFQIHRSHLVNLYFVKQFVRSEAVFVMRHHSGGIDVRLPLAEIRKEEFFRTMEELETFEQQAAV